MNKVKWSNHEFGVFGPPGTVAWNDVPGVYIFTGLNTSNRWVAIYIGKAESFSSRLPNHERWAEAARLGATHVHAMVVQQEANRDSIEKDLIQTFQPTLNTQLKSLW